MRETGKRLHQRGHEVVAINSDRPNVRGFDIVHVFNCRIETRSSNRSPVAKKPGASCGLSYLDLAGSSTWGSRGTVAVLRQAVAEVKKAAVLLKQLKERELEVELPQGIANAEGRGGCWPIQRKAMRELLRQVDGLLPNSWLNHSHCETICNGMAIVLKLLITESTPNYFWMPTQSRSDKRQESTDHLYCRRDGSNRPRIKQCCAGLSKTHHYQSCSSGVVNIGHRMQISAKQSAVIG